MEEDPPPKPDDPAEPHTAARPLRGRGDSRSSSASSGSITSTRTLHSIDLTEVTENDRIYPDEHYYMPCDAAEQDRLSILHRVYVAALGDKLTTAPITAATTRILDVGSGPGDWAVGISERFPCAEVVGVDLAVWDVEAVEAERHHGQPDGGEPSGCERGVHWEIDDLDVWNEEEPVPSLQKAMENLSPFKAPESDHDTPNTTISHTASTQTATDSAVEDRRPPTSSDVQQPPLTTTTKGKGNGPAPHYPPNPLYTLAPTPSPGWNFSEPFDFVHIRGLRGAFTSWPALYAEVYKSLAPGGWIEVADYSFAPLDQPDILNSPLPVSTSIAAGSGVGTKPKPPSAARLPHFHKLFHETRRALSGYPRPLNTTYLDPSLLRSAGFVDVRMTQVNVPVGTWPQDPRQKALGKMFAVTLVEGCEAHCLRLLTRYGGWSKEEVRELVELVKGEVMRCAVGEGGREAEGWVGTFRWVVGRKGTG